MKASLLQLDTYALKHRGPALSAVDRPLSITTSLQVLRGVIGVQVIFVIVLGVLYLQGGGKSGPAGQNGLLSGGLGALTVFGPILNLSLYALTLNSYFDSRRQWKEQVKNHLLLFVRDNGLAFTSKKPSTESDSALLRNSKRPLKNILTIKDSTLDAEIGTFSKRTHGMNEDFGYLRLGLNHAQPHVILDAKKNDRFRASDLPARFSQKQILGLEGDFNDYFTVYAAEDTQIDTLSVLTPDVMALLVDYSDRYNIEIVGSSVYFFWNGSSAMLDTETTQELEKIVNTFGEKLLAKAGSEQILGSTNVADITVLPPYNVLAEVTFYLFATFGAVFLLYVIQR